MTHKNAQHTAEIVAYRHKLKEAQNLILELSEFLTARSNHSPDQYLEWVDHIKRITYDMDLYSDTVVKYMRRYLDD